MLNFWEEMVVSVASMAILWNLLQTCYDLCICGPNMVILLVVNLVLTLVCLIIATNTLKRLEMQNDDC